MSLNGASMAVSTWQPIIFKLIARFDFKILASQHMSYKMYQQIAPPSKAKPFNRFMWQDDPKVELWSVQMTRLTYGVKPLTFFESLKVI